MDGPYKNKVAMEMYFFKRSINHIMVDGARWPYPNTPLRVFSQE